MARPITSKSAMQAQPKAAVPRVKGKKVASPRQGTAATVFQQVPLISIITPSFNQGRYIEETIRSVVEQNYPRIEYIVMDGGSTDETVSVIRRYEEHIAYWVSEPDRGQADALKRGFARATGDILTWVNSDDALVPGALAAVASAFATGQADIVAGIVNVWQGSTLAYRHRTGCPPGPLNVEWIVDLEREWLTGRFFYQPEVFFSRAIYERAGGTIDDTLHYSMDYDLWLRCARAGARILPIDVELANFRLHPDQKTSSTAAYLPELVRHANVTRVDLGLPLAYPTEAGGGTRPLRVGVLNDLGFKYGAGRAHGRIAACLAENGTDVFVFSFRDSLDDPYSWKFTDAISALKGAGVDVVLLGNLHNAFPEGVDLSSLAEVAPLLLVMHDFFWLTGRCAYQMGCDGYLFTCPAQCPTREEYPRIPYEHIPVAHARKRKILATSNIRLLANSAYTETIARGALAVTMPALDLGDKIRRINLPIPESAYHPYERESARSALGLTDDMMMVLTSSTSVTDRRKGFYHVVEACRLVGDARLCLFAIGQVNEDQRVEGVRYLGHLDGDRRIAEVFRAADVFVAATADETFGQTFVEAALCGCPSIGYAVGAVPEVVLPEVTGWLVPRNDIAGIAEKIRALLAANPNVREAMRLRARQYAAARYGAPSFIAGMNDIFRDIVSDPDAKVPTGVQFDGSRSTEIHFLQGRRAAFKAGVAPWEGPFPDLGVNRKIAWQIAAQAELALTATRAGMHRLIFSFANLFRPQIVILRLDDQELIRVAVEPESWEVTYEVSVPLNLRLGDTRLTLNAPEAFDAGDRLLHIAFLHLALEEAANGGMEPISRRVVSTEITALSSLDEDTGAEIVRQPRGQVLRSNLTLVAGFSLIEGPYPEIGTPMRLAWQTESSARVAVFMDEHQYTIRFDIFVPCAQDVVFRLGDNELGLQLSPTGVWKEPKRLEWPLADLDQGWHEVEITCTNVLIDDSGRGLRLAILAPPIESGLAEEDPYPFEAVPSELAG